MNLYLKPLLAHWQADKLEIKTISEIPDVLYSVIERFTDAIVPLTGAIVLIIVGWILGKIAGFIVKRVLQALKVERLSEKIREVDLFNRLDLRLSRIAAQITFWCVFLIFWIAASETLGFDTISNGIGSVLSYLPRLLTATIIFVIGVMIANIIRKVVEATTSSMGISGSRLISQFIFYFLVVLISINSLNQAGMDTEIISVNVTIAIAAIFFAFALSYGFASKDILANMLAAFYGRSKFTIGQNVRIDDTEGTIIKLDNTSVTIDDGTVQTIIPIHKMLTEKVEILPIGQDPMG